MHNSTVIKALNEFVNIANRRR